MFWTLLLPFRSKNKTKTVSSYRPWVDQLEKRDCPTVSGPHITLSAAVETNHMVVLSGAVTGDQHNNGVSVSLSGAASGSTTTGADGTFSFTTSSASLGTVYASGVDQQGKSTNTAQATIAVAAPVLGFSISYGTGTNVTLSGTLTDVDAGGQTITFSGVATGSVQTDSSGNFSLTTTASGLGEIDATETDLWGQASNLADEMVAPPPPEISVFGSTCNTGSYWILDGTVTGQNVAGLTVSFRSATTDFGGTSAVVCYDGTFDLTLLLPAGQSGSVIATVTDQWGQVSEEAWTFVGV